jgi:hypothetical protein
MVTSEIGMEMDSIALGIKGVVSIPILCTLPALTGWLMSVPCLSYRFRPKIIQASPRIHPHISQNCGASLAHDRVALIDFRINEMHYACRWHIICAIFFTLRKGVRWNYLIETYLRDI